MRLDIGGLSKVLCARGELFACNRVEILAEPLESLVARLDWIPLDTYPLCSLAIPLPNDFFLFGIVIIFDQVIVKIRHPDANFGHREHCL